MSSSKHSTSMNIPVPSIATGSPDDGQQRPITIGLLGDFRVLQGSQIMPFRAGGKSETVLAYLALQGANPLSRTTLVNLLWPGMAPTLASHSLSNVVLTLQKLLAPALQGAPPFVHQTGFLSLNVAAGIGIDICYFDELGQLGDRHAEGGDIATAMSYYTRAALWYRGDLCIAVDPRTIMERERLRARCLTLLSQLTDYHFRSGDTTTCLDHLWHLLAVDPCHEEAHRMVMRCYMRQGQRGAALRQYHLCVDLLHTRFGAVPETATVALYEQFRDEPKLLGSDMIET